MTAPAMNPLNAIVAQIAALASTLDPEHHDGETYYWLGDVCQLLHLDPEDAYEWVRDDLLNGCEPWVSGTGVAMLALRSDHPAAIAAQAFAVERIHPLMAARKGAEGA